MRTYGKVRELICIKYKTMDAFAQAIPMSRSGLSRKLNGIAAWSQSEIERTCILLGIPMSEVGDHFFY